MNYTIRALGVRASALRVLLRISLLAGGLWAGSAAAAQELPASLFGELPFISDAEISPDGASVAMVQAGDGKTLIVFYDLVGEGAPVAVELGESRPRDIVWGNHEKLLMRATKTIELTTNAGKKKYEFGQYFSIDRHDGSIVQMMNGSDAFNLIIGAGALFHSMPDDPRHVLIAQFDPSRSGARRGYNLYLADLYTGRERLFEKGEPETIDWIIDEDANVVGRVDFDNTKEERVIYKRQPDSSRYKEVARYREPPGEGVKITIAGAGKSPLRPVARSYNGSDKLSVFEYDLANGAISTPLFQSATYDVNYTIYDPNTGRVIGANYIDDFQRNVFFDDRRRSLFEALSAALPAAAITLRSETADGSAAIIRAAYRDRSPEFYLYDDNAKSVSLLGTAYDDKTAGVAIRERFDVQAEDGLIIRGYLTVPAGREKQNLPLIVLPHGGPEGRDSMEFDWWAAFYASRGYLVYQPNFRGSDGYGFSFRAAGFGEWGRKMQSDVTAGVEKLVAGGIADRGRICIVGASYGGYAALAGATLTPDLYKCAVSVNGVADLVHILSHKRRSGEYSLAYWERRIGDLGRERKKIMSVSPVANAHKVKAAVLLLHGKDDIVVPISHAKRMRDALREAGKPVIFMELEGEDHWLSDGPTRLRMLGASIAFIDRHIGDGGGQGASTAAQ